MKRILASSWLLFFACFLGLGLFWSLTPESRRPPAWGDYAGFYQPAAQKLLDGRGIHGLTYPPGEPAFLAVAYFCADKIGTARDGVVVWMQALCHAICAALVAALSATLVGRRTSVLAGWAWAVYPPAVWMVGLPGSSELPFMALLLGSVWWFWTAVRQEEKISAWRLFGSGVCLGLAMLFRPIALPLPVVMAFFLLLRARRPIVRRFVWPAGVFLFAVFLTVLPWEGWVYAKHGKIIPLSSNGPASIADGLAFATTRQGDVVLPVSPEVQSIMVDLRRQDIDRKLQTNADIGAWVRRQLTDHPKAMMQIFGMKVLRCWYGTDSHRHESRVLLVNLVYVGLSLIGMGIACRRSSSNRWLALLVVLLVLCNWGMASLVLPIARYMVPVMPLLAIWIPALFGVQEETAAATAS
ncbi:MAG: glycosyltransferase family 39 protein [Thermoguttaceae bacterium]